MPDPTVPLARFNHRITVRQDEHAPEGTSRYQAVCSCGEWVGEWHEGPAPLSPASLDEVKRSAQNDPHALRHYHEKMDAPLRELITRFQGKRIRFFSIAPHDPHWVEGVFQGVPTEAPFWEGAFFAGQGLLRISSSFQSATYVAPCNIASEPEEVVIIRVSSLPA